MSGDLRGEQTWVGVPRPNFQPFPWSLSLSRTRFLHFAPLFYFTARFLLCGLVSLPPKSFILVGTFLPNVLPGKAGARTEGLQS